MIDSGLHFLNKSRIPFATLYDRVFPYAQLPDLTDGDTISTGYFLQAFSELQRAQYAPADTSDTAFGYHNARRFITGDNLSGKLPVFVLNARYATVDTNSIQDGRFVVVDSFLHDGPNTALPYIAHSLTLPAIGQLEPLKAGVAYQSPTTDYTHVPAGTSGYVPIAGTSTPVWAMVQTGCRATGWSDRLFNEFTRQPPGNVSVEIYPNPTTANWNLLLSPDAGTLQARLNNAAGQMMWSGTLHAEDGASSLHTIPGAALPPGTYYLLLHTEGETYSHTLLRQ